MSIASNLRDIKGSLPEGATLVAVTKYSEQEEIMEAYEAGHRVFGENKVQDLTAKYGAMPKDIEWQFLGHLQRNKVKYIAPFVSLIQACDSERLLAEINKQGAKVNRQIPCLLQVRIAQEESKFGLLPSDLKAMVESGSFANWPFVKVEGVMAMATNTSDNEQVAHEFAIAKEVFDWLKEHSTGANFEVRTLSMGMTQDYKIALSQGANMIRIGSAIFKS